MSTSVPIEAKYIEGNLIELVNIVPASPSHDLQSYGIAHSLHQIALLEASL